MGERERREATIEEQAVNGALQIVETSVYGRKVILFPSIPLIPFSRLMDMERPKLLVLDCIRVFVRLAIVAAQAEYGVEPRHLVAKNRREVQDVKHALSSRQHELAPLRSNDLEVSALVLIALDLLRQRTKAVRDRLGFEDQLPNHGV